MVGITFATIDSFDTMVVLIPLSIAKYHIVLIGLSKGEYVYHVSKHISTNLRQIVDDIKEKNWQWQIPQRKGEACTHIAHIGAIKSIYGKANLIIRQLVHVE